jgi:hypothetical protein
MRRNPLTPQRRGTEGKGTNVGEVYVSLARLHDFVAAAPVQEVI